MARITRRRVSRRSSKRASRPLRKRTYRRKRLSRTGGASFYNKRIKPARKYNKGKLRLQRALVRGGSLPNETSTHVYYRGMATTRKGTEANPSAAPSAVDMMQMYNDFSACDQTFILNKLGGPCISSFWPKSYDNSKFGKFSYQDVWTSLYGKGLVMGSKLVVHVKKSLYPSQINAIVNATEASTYTYYSKSLPITDLAYGFWYIRYRYHRASKQGDPPEPVGHPMWFSLDPDTPASKISGGAWYTDSRSGEGALWANQRDFMCDPTVTWIRDRLPRATKLKFSRAFDDNPVAEGSGANLNIVHRRKPMFPITETDSEGRIEYELELSNRATKLIAAYSRRKHSFDENPLRNSEWQDLKTLKPITGGDIDFETEKTMFQVRVGYVGFTSDGSTLCNIPADRLGHYLDIQCSYKVRLREPLINPWTGEKDDDDDPMGRPAAAIIPSEPQFDELDPELDEGLSDDEVEDDPLEISEVDEVLEG